MIRTFGGAGIRHGVVVGGGVEVVVVGVGDGGAIGQGGGGAGHDVGGHWKKRGNERLDTTRSQAFVNTPD